MAMVVKNNMGAQRTLNTLNKSNKKLEKAFSKVSTGMKIVGADDDSSGYAISEKMREQIRSLFQDDQNVQNGQSLFKTAAGGIDNIVEELRTLKELAIKSANDTNTDDDRLIIQKEFEQRKANINDIATETDYNTIRLLDGMVGRTIIKTDIVSSSSNRLLTEPTSPITTISSGNYTINSDGVYVLANGYTGNITVNAQNVKITQEDSTTVLNNVSILGPSGGNANMWIEDLNIKNTIDKNVIKFRDTNNFLSVKGDNVLGVESDGSYPAWKSATINVGSGLTIEGHDSATLDVSHRLRSGGIITTGSAIGSDGKENNNNGYIVIKAGVAISAYAEIGAAIGSGGKNDGIGGIGAA